MDIIKNSVYGGDVLPANIENNSNIPTSIFGKPTHPCEIKCMNETIYNDENNEFVNESEHEHEHEHEHESESETDSDELINIAVNIGTTKKESIPKKINTNIKENDCNKVQQLSSLIESWKSDRCSWDEYFSCISLLISTRSPSKRLKVGSVIVKNNRIISAGYNGFPSGTPHVSIMRDSHEQNTIHAEQNAIADAARRGVSIDESTIYVTHRPCINCTKFIISSGIKHIKYLKDYRNDDLVEKLLKTSNISLQKV